MFLNIRILNINTYICIYLGIYLSFLFGINNFKIISLVTLSIVSMIYLFKNKEFIYFCNKTFYNFYMIYSLFIAVIYFSVNSMIKQLIFLSFILIMYIFSKYKNLLLLKVNFYTILILLIFSLVINFPNLHLNPLNYFLDRYIGIYGTNQTGIISLFLGIYSLLFIKETKYTTNFIILFFFAFLLILTTGSRTSLLTLIFSIFLFKFKINKFILSLFLILEISLIFFSNDIFEIVMRFIENNQDNNLMKLLRFDIYSIRLRLEGSLFSAFEISKNNLFLPYGFNILNDIKENNDIFVDNSYLSILIEMGLLGLIIFISFLIRILYIIEDKYIFIYFPIISVLFFFENIWSFSLFNVWALSLFGYAIQMKRI